jgi:hypothetical protein
MAATQEMKQFAIAIATANRHPAPEDWADAVIGAFDAQQAPAPALAPTPAATEVTGMPETGTPAQ